MNREMKFSLWDKAKKEWLLKEFSMIGENMIMGVYMQILNDYFPDRLNDLELVQYTGMKDNNGKEIYEGDIIEEGIVYFDNEYLGFFVKGEFSEGQHKPLYDIVLAEVIGNIYENPELLEAK